MAAMMKDADGLDRADLTWTIEGRKGTRTGNLYGLHEQELAEAERVIRSQARRGDTVTIRVY